MWQPPVTMWQKAPHKPVVTSNCKYTPCIIIDNNFVLVGIIQHLEIFQTVFRPKKLIKVN